MDNLRVHKMAGIREAIEAVGAKLLFIPPYSPDLNPIELAFSKLKALLRAKAIRTADALWKALGDLCGSFSPRECANYFRHDGYSSQRENALAAFKATAPCLGLAPRLVHAIDWLFKFTQPQDWESGGRPIVWPSAATQQEALGLSQSQAKTLNSGLIEAGLISMKDSPNGKRYGRRDHRGHITEA